LFKGTIKPSHLNSFIVTETYNNLEKGAAIGYGNDWVKFDSVNSKTVQQLKSNLYLFSGAKCYGQLMDMNKQLVDANGKIRTFNEFKKKMFEIHKNYNRNYLQAEYQTAKASAQRAREWQTFENQKHLYPNLKYKTIGDDRVRDEHAALNGIIKSIDDPFWDIHYPPNGWRCRCSVTSTKSNITKSDIKIKIDKRFSQNVGKTKQIFNQENHPYFSIPKSDQREVSKTLENWKEKYPQYKLIYKAKNGSNLHVSAFADNSTRELVANYEVAKTIVHTLKFDVKLTPHVLIDKVKNPEYLIKGKVSDRKTPIGKNFRSLLTKARNQKVEILVIDLNHSIITQQKIINQLAGSFKNKSSYPTIKEIIFVSKDRKKVTHLKRSEIKKSKE